MFIWRSRSLVVTPSMTISFIFQIAFGSVLLLLEPLLHFLILFSKLFDGGRKSLDLLSQGCRILIGLHLNIKVDGNCVFKSEYENVVPTDGAKLMKGRFINLIGCVQMEPRCRLRGWRNGKLASLGWPPVWCLPQRLQCQSQY